MGRKRKLQMSLSSSTATTCSSSNNVTSNDLSSMSHSSGASAASSLSLVQRTAANDRERTRMRVLSKAFIRLKTSLPWVPADTKLSKLDTLKLASSYIAYLTKLLQQDENTSSSRKPLETAPHGDADSMPMTGLDHTYIEFADIQHTLCLNTRMFANMRYTTAARSINNSNNNNNSGGVNGANSGEAKNRKTLDHLANSSISVNGAALIKSQCKERVD